jgi:hypothetical protein
MGLYMKTKEELSWVSIREEIDLTHTKWNRNLSLLQAKQLLPREAIVSCNNPSLVNHQLWKIKEIHILNLNIYQSWARLQIALWLDNFPDQ